MSNATPELAPPVCVDGEVLENRWITPVTKVMKIHAPDVAPGMQPGQFVNLETTKTLVPMLRRPMSIHKVVKHQGIASGFCVLYDVIGPGTQNLSEMTPGTKISFVGPLGNMITVPETARRATIIAGGVGIGPVKFVAESLQERGMRDITVVYGARDADHSVPVHEAMPDGCRPLLCTDDGSVGRKGFVTSWTEELIERNRLTPGDYVFTCGPHAMFKAVRDLLGKHGIAAEAATEEFMGCGFGVCFGCPLYQRQPDGQVEMKLCCVDGCLFPLDTLVFEGELEDGVSA
ncbi:MAG: dihydroorotate dehydrogenase electron transfer subunit [Planctomycetota bacterium]|nr:dihydroorotate dehydrogenase electron transfer subunit [Planctomycetota bacterium]